MVGCGLAAILDGVWIVFGFVMLWFAGSQGMGQWLGSGDAQLVRGIRPITSYELLPRWQQWQEILLPTLGFDIRIVILAVMGIVLWRGGVVERILTAFGLGYFAFHWLLATAVFDRYMLPFVTLLLLLLARSVTLVVRALHLPNAAPLLLIFMLLWPNAAVARLGRWDVGGMPGADLGTQTLTKFFADQPYGTVLYDHFYSWHARYYLFDSRVYVAWMPHPDSLVADLNAHYDDSRYLILPIDARAQPFEDALNEAGYGLETRLQSGEIVVLKILRDDGP